MSVNEKHFSNGDFNQIMSNFFYISNEATMAYIMINAFGLKNTF